MITKILERRRHWMEKKWSKCRLLCCFKLVPLRGKNVWKPRPSGVILVPFRVFSENFQRAPTSFLCGSPPEAFAFCVKS